MLKLAVLLLLIYNVCGDYKVLQITDFHMDVDYSVKGSEDKKCHTQNSLDKVIRDHSLGKFGNYKCDSPIALVENAVKSAAKLFPNPDLILWTGDNVPHIDNYTSDYLIEALNKTTGFLKQYFPGVQILPTYGNHDHAPSGNFTEDDQDYYSETFELWKEWIGEDKNDTFLKGGYYRYIHNNTIFLVLNTNYYYDMDKIEFKNPKDPADQFKFMENQLAEARNNEQSVNIVAHIAPGAYERKANYTWFRDEYNAKFLQIVNSNLDVIKSMIFGHHHTDTFHIVRDSKGTATQVCYMCPAVTPWYSGLGKAANNPAFRIYFYDSAKNWQLNDIKTYFVNLTSLNDNPDASWTLEYSFKDAYSLTDFSAKSLDDLVTRIDKDEKLYKTYLDHNSVKYGTNQLEDADKLAQICSLKHADYVEYRQCLNYGESMMFVDKFVLLIPIIVAFFKLR